MSAGGSGRVDAGVVTAGALRLVADAHLGRDDTEVRVGARASAIAVIAVLVGTAKPSGLDGAGVQNDEVLRPDGRLVHERMGHQRDVTVRRHPLHDLEAHFGLAGLDANLRVQPRDLVDDLHDGVAAESNPLVWLALDVHLEDGTQEAVEVVPLGVGRLRLLMRGELGLDAIHGAIGLAAQDAHLLLAPHHRSLDVFCVEQRRIALVLGNDVAGMVLDSARSASDIPGVPENLDEVETREADIRHCHRLGAAFLVRRTDALRFDRSAAAIDGSDGRAAEAARDRGIAAGDAVDQHVLASGWHVEDDTRNDLRDVAERDRCAGGGVVGDGVLAGEMVLFEPRHDRVACPAGWHPRREGEKRCCAGGHRLEKRGCEITPAIGLDALVRREDAFHCHWLLPREWLLKRLLLLLLLTGVILRDAEKIHPIFSFTRGSTWKAIIVVVAATIRGVGIECLQAHDVFGRLGA